MKKVKCKSITDLDSNYIVRDGKRFVSDIETWQIKNDTETPEGVYNFDLDKKVNDISDITPILPDLSEKGYIYLETEGQTLKRLSEFCSKDVLRPNLQAISIYDGRFWASDAHRLIKLPIQGLLSEVPKDGHNAVQISPKIVKLLPNKGKVIVRALKDQRAVLECDGITYFCTSPFNTPPNYAQVMPHKDEAVHVLKFVNNIDFKKHLAVKAKYIKLTFACERVTLRSENIDLNLEFEQELDSNYPYVESLEIAFDLKLLERAINKDKEVIIYYNGVTKYGGARPSYVNNTLLMPTQL